MASTTALPQRRRLTVADYRDLPETGPRYQLIEGDLFIAPAPNRYHQDISRNLEFILLTYLKANPIGVLYDAPFDVYLDETNAFQPDIAFFSNERRDALIDAGAEGAPDLVVEILSPKTARLDLNQKRSVYGRSGVKELWIIQPDSRTVLVCKPSEEAEKPVAIYGENESLATPLLPGLEISLAEVFAKP